MIALIQCIIYDITHSRTTGCELRRIFLIKAEKSASAIQKEFSSPRVVTRLLARRSDLFAKIQMKVDSKARVGANRPSNRLDASHSKVQTPVEQFDAVKTAFQDSSIAALFIST
jgi:hypothetical protein